MARFLKDRSNAKGEVPGSLVLIGKQKMEKPIIHGMLFNTEQLKERQFDTIDEVVTEFIPDGVNWINIYGLHDLKLIEKLGKTFNLPALLLEDVLNTDQIPKYENGDTFDAFILKILHERNDSERVGSEQITIIVGQNYVLSLQERKGDFFDSVRERIRKNKGRIRYSGNDYMAFSLMDSLAENYAYLIEKIGRNIENNEDRLFKNMDSHVVEEIYQYKTELNFMRKSVRPYKEFLPILIKTEDTYFQEKNIGFLHDLNDLLKQCAEAIEAYNSMASDQLNIYNSNMGNKMNEVMKTLTIFASLFIPLTFFAGIYGMNFENIPELKFKYGYHIFWLFILIMAGGLFIFFKRKKWF